MRRGGFRRIVYGESSNFRWHRSAGREGGPEVVENYILYKSVWIDLF